MLGNHLDQDVLERFLYLELQPQDLREAAWHLSLCERCRRALNQVAPGGHVLLRLLTGGAEFVDAGGDDYGAAFAGAKGMALARAQALAVERRWAPAVVAELLALQPRRRWARLRSDPALASFAVGEALVAESRRLWTDDNRGAEEVARLALAVADRLTGGGSEAGRQAAVEDLRAEAWAAIGTARRLTSDLRRADESFAAACDHLRRGSGEPLVRASLLSQLSSLRREQRRFAEADRLLTRVCALYRRAGDDHLVGKTLVGRALLQSCRGDGEASIRTLEEASGLIDSEREPRLFQAARHNLLNALVEAGRYPEAAVVLPAVRELTRRLGKRRDLLSLEWLEGRLAAGLGHLAEAEEKFLAAREGFIRAGNGFGAALVSLDLAICYLETGRPGLVKRLAGEMLPIFESRDVHRETVAALALFQQAVAAETITASIVRDLAGHLRRTGEDPRSRFERPS
jgi:tetratricopeptide (TPR) repeat protein